MTGYGKFRYRFSSESQRLRPNLLNSTKFAATTTIKFSIGYSPTQQGKSNNSKRPSSNTSKMRDFPLQFLLSPSYCPPTYIFKLPSSMNPFPFFPQAIKHLLKLCLPSQLSTSHSLHQTILLSHGNNAPLRFTQANFSHQITPPSQASNPSIRR
jgi:hypothetical protein